MLFVFALMAAMFGEHDQSPMDLQISEENLLTDLSQQYSIQFPSHWVFMDSNAMSANREEVFHDAMQTFSWIR